MRGQGIFPPALEGQGNVTYDKSRCQKFHHWQQEFFVVYVVPWRSCLTLV